MKYILNFGNIIVLSLIILLAIIGFIRSDFIKEKSYTSESFGIKNLYSEVDKDADGIDDFTDILEGAREFVLKKPKYKSKYYKGGYPTDQYSVCTDVLWYALKNAGYNIKEMIDIDIKNRQEDYDIDKIDSNIDFRRVKNIDVYFSKYLESLTIDPNEIEKWQPGDIVIYKNHLAIISDKRNKEGKPFIIHHDGGLRYEENALEEKEIIAHYRFILKDEEKNEKRN